MNVCMGTCSLCGGRVTVPALWGGIVPPTPTCEACGAFKAGHGPVIDMTPAPLGKAFHTTTTTVVAPTGALPPWWYERGVKVYRDYASYCDL